MFMLIYPNASVLSIPKSAVPHVMELFWTVLILAVCFFKIPLIPCLCWSSQRSIEKGFHYQYSICISCLPILATYPVYRGILDSTVITTEPLRLFVFTRPGGEGCSDPLFRGEKLAHMVKVELQLLCLLDKILFLHGLDPPKRVIGCTWSKLRSRVVHDMGVCMRWLDWEIWMDVFSRSVAMISIHSAVFWYLT
jgi:hypothetical protein